MRILRVHSRRSNTVCCYVCRCCSSCLQGVTTALRDAVHRASEGVSAAGNAAANVAGAAVDKTKEALQVCDHMRVWGG